MMRKITLDRENNTLVISTEPKTEEIHFQSLPDKEDIRFQLKKELADIVAQVKELKQRAEEIQEILSLLGPRETQLK